MQEALDKYPNLLYLSRDRGKQYQKLNDSYIHIADRFHLLANLTEYIIASLKAEMANRIKLTKSIEMTAEQVLPKLVVITKEKEDENTIAQTNEIQLIKEVKLEYEKNRSFRKTAKIYKIDRKTVKKYVEMKNIKEESKYKRDSTSRLAPYTERILTLYNSGMQITKIHELLMEENVVTKYVTLSAFVRRNRESKYCKSEVVKKEVAEKIESTIIRRNQVINYTFQFKGKNKILEHAETLVDKHPIIATYRDFYDKFKKILVGLDYRSLKKILKHTFKNEVIDRYVKNLNKDYKAVLNASKYKMNNGIVEGSVGKLKKIKHEMFGRAGYKLLRNKVIYQSKNF
ncbi:MAG: transposase [Alkaliphilus sp.]